MAHRGMWPRLCWHRRSSQGAESNDKKTVEQAVADAETPSRVTGSGGIGSLPRRVHHEGAHRRRHPVPAGGTGGHRGSVSRLDRVRRGDGQPADRAPGSGSSQIPPGPGPGGQGLFLDGDPHRAACPRHQGHDPEQGRRDHRPSPPGQQGRAATGVRQGGVQDTQRRRSTINKLRQTRAVATRCDKREFVYRGTIDVASIRIWLRDPPETHLRDTA